MQDTVIKGNGRSRIIKGPADMPTTYEEWRAQVMDGTAQLDVSVNPDTTKSGGISQLGTPLDKANLLTDEAAALFGLSDTATIDAMFKALWALRGSKNGFATLDSNAKLANSQMQSLIEYPTYSLGMSYGEYSSGEISCMVIQRKICILTGYAIFKGHDGTSVFLDFNLLKIGETYYKPKLKYSAATISGKSNADLTDIVLLDPLNGVIQNYGNRGFSLRTILRDLSLDARNLINFSAIFEIEPGS